VSLILKTISFFLIIFLFVSLFSYEGEVADEYSVDNATHIVVVDDNEEESSKTNKSAKRISIEVLWKSIKNKKSL
jgi:hypothetical protein